MKEIGYSQLPFIFAVLVEIVASLVLKSLFHLWVTFQFEIFSYFISTETFAIVFQYWFYLKKDFTRSFVAVLRALFYFLTAAAHIFDCNCGYSYLQWRVVLPAIAGIFACNSKVFLLVLAGFLPAIASVFTSDCGFLPANGMCLCLQKQAICLLVASKFAWVPHVKIPEKYWLYSGKLACGCRQFAYSARFACRVDAN